MKIFTLILKSIDARHTTNWEADQVIHVIDEEYEYIINILNFYIMEPSAEQT